MKISSPYNFLLILRIIFVFFGFGYIHPDAYFQSSEIIAADVFGFEATRTWEFDPSLPCRSILPPAIFSGIPFLTLKGLSYIFPRIINPYTLLYFPRLFLLLSSFILDITVWDLSGHDMDALITLGSSWVLFVLINNGFSNSIETILVAIALRLVFQQKKNWSSHAAFGSLIALGVFNRFTFAFFIFPLILYLLYEELKDKEKGDWASLLTGLLAGFFFTSMGIILIDSIYYGSIAFTINNKPFRLLDLLCPSFYSNLSTSLSTLNLTSFSWTVAPINSLLYNIKSENLAEHGTHLRITHLLWNTPLLFAHLAFFAIAPYYIWLDDKLGEMIGQTPGGMGKKKYITPVVKGLPKKTATNKDNKNEVKEKPKMKLQEGKFTTGKLAIVGVILSPLLFLSFANHQEMRFLYALLVPFVVLGYKKIWGSESDIYTKSGWVAFNIILLLIMGVHHQGGLVPTILKLSSQSQLTTTGTTHVVFFHTYMPPKHLFAIKEGEGKSKFVIHDLMGAEVQDLRKLLLRITELYQYDSTVDKIYIVTPSLTDIDILESLPIRRQQWCHLSFEDWPVSVSDWFSLSLNVYEYIPGQISLVKEGTSGSGSGSGSGKPLGVKDEEW